MSKKKPKKAGHPRSLGYKACWLVEFDPTDDFTDRIMREVDIEPPCVAVSLYPFEPGTIFFNIITGERRRVIERNRWRSGSKRIRFTERITTDGNTKDTKSARIHVRAVAQTG